MESKSEVGIIGLGTMGRNLLLNVSDNGFGVSGYDINKAQVQLTLDEKRANAFATSDLKEFVASLNKPARIIMLVPAGKIVDLVIADLKPLLSPGDIIIDGGNSYYKDTNRRYQELKDTKLHFMGMGVSGGESGARTGPSIMPGGDEEAYHAIEPVLNAIAAKSNGEACAQYMGNGSAGHYVKMVHNGIEYGMMQIIAEAYGMMRHVAHHSNTTIADFFEHCSQDMLSGYLIESAIIVLRKKDDLAEGDLLDHVEDAAKSKGTGKWTSQDAMDLQVPVPTIDMAVMTRDLSSWIDLRNTLMSPDVSFTHHKTDISEAKLQRAIYCAFLLDYTQGLHQIAQASKSYEYNTDLGKVIRNWRAGCIIRSSLLPLLDQAHQSSPEADHLLQNKELYAETIKYLPDLHYIVNISLESGYPLPCMQSALTYFQMLSSGALGQNMIQGLRDHFGAHTYERSDREGIYHIDWETDGKSTKIK